MSKLKDKQFKTKGALYPFLRRLLTYTFRYPKWVAGFTGFVLFVALIEAIYPLVWLSLIDTVIVPAVESYKTNAAVVNFDTSVLTKYGLTFAGLGLLLAFGVFCFINFAGRIQEYVMYDIRQELFKKLQELSFSFYDKSAVGWLLSRISSDTIKVTELVSWTMIEAIWGAGMIVFCVTAMFIYNWKLAVIVTAAIPILSLISFKLRMLILKYSREARKYNSEITARFNEHINGVEVNKSLVQEERVSEDFTLLSEKMRISSYKAAYYQAIFMPLIIFGGSTAAALVIYYGGSMAIAVPAAITVGTLAAFFGYATMIFEPILDISRFYSQAQNSISAGERIFSLIDTKPLIVNSNGAKDYGRITGDIEFENVSFQYLEGKPVLENMNLKIEAGTSVALVGETGGGKSTIINLICRFYEPTDGMIKIDGIDYKERTMESLRSQLGVVLQTPHLFSGTVKENIKYGRDEASDIEVIDALRTVGADEFIQRLDEQVGEGGEHLSLGEKQLVSFARAVLADPRIFIMDEATSSVDTLTEANIQRGIVGIMEGRTSIIIAHRLSTIKNSDRILVISKGKIIEDGSHRELMMKQGTYYKLYTRQLREEREKICLQQAGVMNVA
ncbi:MAG: ABC transporter ATP-binding protein/permease [Chlorobi bacterium]|nr:ABC transporter ATP-binding protein/permease [Chlorobiota bacterium]MCI0715753.1 ABC transporter ATP-binding protein/permease [Chlorobiota bacterium]